MCVRCKVFVPNCANCIDGPVCTACNTGYFFNTSSSSNPQPCVACTSILNCVACIVGPVCNQCRSNTFSNLSSVQKQCHPCSIFPNCAVCSNGPVCDSCIAGYFFNLSSTATQKPCVACSSIQNCAACISGPVCNQCVSNTFFNLDSALKQCYPCSIFPNCATCQDGPKCTVCQTGYFLNSSTLRTFQIISAKPECFSCSLFSNCAQCMQTEPLCIQCVAGGYHDLSSGIYFQNSATNSCILCSTINNCLTCADGIVCILCEQNFIIDVSTGNKSCFGCAPDEYSFNNICSNCTLDIKNCSSCFHTGTILNCTACYYPYRLGTSGKCDACEKGFQMLQDHCIKPIGCQKANPDYSKCIACFAIYNFVFDPSNSMCTCRYGYKLVKINGSSRCVNDCGDGVTSVPDEKCDDGNFIDGDGCGSNCQVQNDFYCTFDSPSKCTLYLNVTELKYNYAYRIEGKNRCKFSFSVHPFHSAFKYVVWSKYLSITISEDFIIANSQSYKYFPATNQITLDFDYKETIEELQTKAALSFKHNSRRLMQVSGRNLGQINAYNFVGVASSTSAEVGLEIFSIPHQLQVQIQIYGRNMQLTFDDQNLLMMYKTLTVGYLSLTIIITSLFLLGSYFHKMIGLQTLQILQFIYVINMLVEEEPSLKPLNVLKYSAFGGYSDYELIFGNIAQQAQLLTFATVSKNFIAVGLMRFFLLNVNFPLILPIIALIAYGIFMAKKYRQRTKYLRLLDINEKDLYIAKRRKAQWVYDHFVFPLINLFSFIAFFCTILDLKPDDKTSKLDLQNENQFDLVEKTSFMTNLLFILMTFFIISYEVFLSYEQFVHSRLTEKEKMQIPTTMIQKLQHDQNNPDRENYKPGYVLVYMIYYLLVEIALMITVLNPQASIYGLEVMLGLIAVYLVIVCCWEPYYKAVQFHNRALKYNHFCALLFTGSCLLMKSMEFLKMTKIIIVFANLLFLTLMCILEIARFRVEHKFRKDLLEKPDLLVEGNIRRKIQNLPQQSKREQLLKNNKYSFTAQMNNFVQKNKILIPKLDQRDDDTIQTIKKMIRDDIYSKKKQSLTNKDNFMTRAYFQQQKSDQNVDPSQKNRRKKRANPNQQ